MVKDNRGVDFVMVEGKLCPTPAGKGCGFVGAQRSRRPRETTGMTDPVQRLKDMDLEGIDTAILFGTSPFSKHAQAFNGCHGASPGGMPGAFRAGTKERRTGFEK